MPGSSRKKMLRRLRPGELTGRAVLEQYLHRAHTTGHADLAKRIDTVGKPATTESQFIDTLLGWGRTVCA